MSVLPCASQDDAQSLKNLVTKWYQADSQFIYNNLPVVSTFSGSDCAFGLDSVSAGWGSVFDGINVMFIPAFFVDPSSFSSYSGILDGIFNVSLSFYFRLFLPKIPGASGTLLGP